MANRVRIVIRARSLEVLRDLLRTDAVDLNCGGPRREEDGTFVVDALVAPDFVAELNRAANRADISVTVDEDFEKRSRERQSEVGSGNRFGAVRNRPRGPGKKE